MDGADGALTVWAVMMCEGEMTQDSKHVPERSVPPLTPRVRKSAPSVCHGGRWGGLGGDKGYARMNGRRIPLATAVGTHHEYRTLQRACEEVGLRLISPPLRFLSGLL